MLEAPSDKAPAKVTLSITWEGTIKIALTWQRDGEKIAYGNRLDPLGKLPAEWIDRVFVSAAAVSGGEDPAGLLALLRNPPRDNPQVLLPRRVRLKSGEGAD